MSSAPERLYQENLQVVDNVIRLYFWGWRYDEDFCESMSQKYNDLVPWHKPANGSIANFAFVCLKNHGRSLAKRIDANRRREHAAMVAWLSGDPPSGQRTDPAPRTEFFLLEANATDRRTLDLPYSDSHFRVVKQFDDISLLRFIQDFGLKEAVSRLTWLRLENVADEEYYTTVSECGAGKRGARHGYVVEADANQFFRYNSITEGTTTASWIEGYGEIDTAWWRGQLDRAVWPIFDLLLQMRALGENPPYGTWQLVGRALDDDPNTVQRRWHRAVARCRENVSKSYERADGRAWRKKISDSSKRR